MKFSKQLYDKDLAHDIHGHRPGQWCWVSFNGPLALGFTNPHVDNGPCVYITSIVKQKDSGTEEEVALKTIYQKLESALKKRQLFKSLQQGKRLFFGMSDDLAGLIVDEYQNAILIQINTAGIDQYRQQIAEFYSRYSSLPVILVDDPKQRQREGLVMHETDKLGPDIPDSLEIQENGFFYSIPFLQAQKNGYYYDHRLNRLKLEQTLKNLNMTFAKGLDLFCYTGSWGLHALRAGVTHMTFVDQAPMNDIIEQNIKRNALEPLSATFLRQDVREFLSKHPCESLYDLIICDPPAFSKSAKTQQNALLGYEKLIASIIPLLNSPGVLAFSSCTHGINSIGLQKLIQKVSFGLNRNPCLLDLGIQGPDHPFETEEDRQAYIKYLCYIF